VEIGGKRYSHVLDPRTGIGLTERVQVTVIGRRAALTDAFATAATVLGVEKGRSLIAAQPSLKAVFVKDNNGKEEVFRSGTIKGN
jgi:thiamine biosynthesis lipoprotein